MYGTDIGWAHYWQVTFPFLFLSTSLWTYPYFLLHIAFPWTGRGLAGSLQLWPKPCNCHGSWADNVFFIRNTNSLGDSGFRFRRWSTDPATLLPTSPSKKYFLAKRQPRPNATPSFCSPYFFSSFFPLPSASFRFLSLFSYPFLFSSLLLAFS